MCKLIRGHKSMCLYYASNFLFISEMAYSNGKYKLLNSSDDPIQPFNKLFSKQNKNLYLVIFHDIQQILCFKTRITTIIPFSLSVLCLAKFHPYWHGKISSDVGQHCLYKKQRSNSSILDCKLSTIIFGKAF